MANLKYCIVEGFTRTCLCFIITSCPLGHNTLVGIESPLISPSHIDVVHKVDV